MAVQEMQILQTVISRHDDLRAQVMTWAVALIGVLTAAYLSDKSELDSGSCGGVGIIVAVLFFWMDVVYKVAQDRAIVRSAEIEAQLRGEGNKLYDGPRVGQSLSPRPTWRDYRKAASNERVWFPFSVLLLLVALAAFGGGRVVSH